MSKVNKIYLSVYFMYVLFKYCSRVIIYFYCHIYFCYLFSQSILKAVPELKRFILNRVNTC